MQIDQKQFIALIVNNNNNKTNNNTTTTIKVLTLTDTTVSFPVLHHHQPTS